MITQMVHQVWPARQQVRLLVRPSIGSHRKPHFICYYFTADTFHSNRGLTGGRLGGIIGGVLAIFVLVFCTSSHWIYSTLQKRREKDGAKLTHHVSSGGSQSSTLVQISPPVSPPGPPLPAAASHSSTIPPLPVPSLSSHFPHLTTMPNQAPQPDAGIRIDARSTGSNVTFIIPRH